MEFRVLTIQDKDSITELFRDVFTQDPWNDDWSDPEQLSAYIDDLIMQSNSLTVGYFSDDELIGLSMGRIKHWYEGTEYCIDEFCIAGPFRHRGIGSRFLGEIEAYLTERGIRLIYLQTDRDVPAHAFYLKNGFRELENTVSLAKISRLSCPPPQAEPHKPCT